MTPSAWEFSVGWQYHTGWPSTPVEFQVDTLGVDTLGADADDYGWRSCGPMLMGSTLRRGGRSSSPVRLSCPSCHPSASPGSSDEGQPHERVRHMAHEVMCRHYPGGEALIPGNTAPCPRI